MKRYINRARVAEIFTRFSSCRVLVVGDLMLDEHIWGAATRVSPEAPVLVVEARQETYVPGGAANTANQIVAFGAQTVIAGVVGRDGAGERLCQHLRAMGAETEAIITTTDRPTTQKTRIVAGNQQIVRVDREKRDPLSGKVQTELITAATGALKNCHALLLSDYDKGVLTRETIHALIDAARAQGIPVTANPKPPTLRHYAGCDIAQLNRTEADQASKSHNFDTTDEITFHEAGKRLRAVIGVKNLLVTRSADGLTVFTEDGDYRDIIPHRVEVYDGTGAGDSTIAGLTLALATGATLEEAVEIGNASGGAVVRKVGVVTASPDEVLALFAEK